MSGAPTPHHEYATLELHGKYTVRRDTHVQTLTRGDGMGFPYLTCYNTGAGEVTEVSDYSSNSGTRDSLTPPYAAFVSFESFLRRAAQEDKPPQVDKALLVGWGIAAGNESGLLTSLKALGIIDDAGKPTELYHEIRLSPPRRTTALRRCIERAYPGLPDGTDGSPSDDRLHDYFVERRGLTGQMVQKAMRFYRHVVAAVGATPMVAEPPVPPPATTQRQSALKPAGREPRGHAVRAEPSPSPVGRPTPRRGRRTGTVGGSGLEPMSMVPTIVIQVAADTDEEELVELFGRVRRAWRRSHGDG